jgi:phospholipase/carboxylesterase
MSDKIHTVGNIKYIETFPQDTDYQQTVIMMHGYGADMYDLAPLNDYIKTKLPTRWIFPQGFLSVPIGPGWTGRAWWNIDLAKWEERIRLSGDMDLSDQAPEGLDTARKNMLDFIKKMKIEPSTLILSGFSQGAMLATDLCLSMDQNIKAMVLFSGNLINKAEWQDKVSGKKGIPFFQSHGTQDAVLGIKGAQKLEGFLQQNGLKGKLHSFSGTHEIPPAVLTKASEFLLGSGC